LSQFDSYDVFVSYYETQKPSRNLSLMSRSTHVKSTHSAAEWGPTNVKDSRNYVKLVCNQHVLGATYPN